MKTALIPLLFFFMHKQGTCDGISFIDSTKIEVCKPKRIHGHHVFEGLAQLGKSTMGWFFGFKLHLVINTQGEILAIRLTPGNCDDRAVVPALSQVLIGKLFADKGYICKQLFKKLLEKGLKLVTPIRAKMKPQLIPQDESLLLKKRSLIESVINQLKYVFHIQHTRHRSVWNFLVNLLAAICAYCLYDRKASLTAAKSAPSKALLT
jgi:transposase